MDKERPNSHSERISTSAVFHRSRLLKAQISTLCSNAVAYPRSLRVHVRNSWFLAASNRRRMLQKGIETPGQLFPGCGSVNWRNPRVDWELELALVKWVLIGLGPHGRSFLKDKRLIGTTFLAFVICNMDKVCSSKSSDLAMAFRSSSFISANFAVYSYFEKFSTLTNLEVLDLSFNWIDNSKILEFIGGISSLKSLNLGGYSLSSVNFTSFKKFSMLTNLEVLDLSSNQINNSKILEFIGGISSLKSLNLGDNSLGSSVNLTSFKKHYILTNLEVLDLSFNSINNSKILEFISRISSLKSLNLGHNSLGSSVDLTSFKKFSILTNLEVLDLSYNSINNSKILEFIGGISSLKFLNLGDNRLGSSVDLTSRNQESKLTNLEVLDLSYNFITNIIWSSLKGFSSLKILDLSWNYMNESISSQDLENMSHLEELYLNDATLPNDFLSYIGAMTSLQVLSLTRSGLIGTLTSHQGCSTPDSCKTRCSRFMQ